MRQLVEAPRDREAREPDRTPMRPPTRAHRFHHLILRGVAQSIADLAEENGGGSPCVSRNVRLGFLAPDVTTTILEGCRPIDLAAGRGRSPPIWRRTGRSSDETSGSGDPRGGLSTSKADPRRLGGNFRSAVRTSGIATESTSGTARASDERADGIGRNGHSRRVPPNPLRETFGQVGRRIRYRMDLVVTRPDGEDHEPSTARRKSPGPSRTKIRQ